MSTTISKLTDGVAELEIYDGSAGCCIFISRDGKGEKFWLDSKEKVEAAIEALRLSQVMEKR